MKVSVFVALLLPFLPIYDAAKILAIFAFPGKSHFLMLHPMARRLAEKGHEVDVVSHFPLKNPIPRYNDINIRGSMPMLTNASIGDIKSRDLISNLIFIFTVGGLNMCDRLFQAEEIQMLTNTTKQYDLLLAHLMPSDCMNAFGGIFKIPIIAVSTTVNQPWSSNVLGIPDNPSYIPHNYSVFSSKMGLLERLWNTISLMVYKYAFDYVQEKADRIIRKHLGEGIPPLKEISKNISLIMTNSHFSIQQPRPFVPNLIEIAGVHIDGKTDLPEYFERALNASSKGVIYLSFGSILMTETLPEETLKVMFETFKDLPYKILWKANRDLFPKHLEIPSNIQFESWMPQLGILCHPNTKLFISHGGMLGTQEANYCGVPILGIPIFADQSLNIKAIAAKGIALGFGFNEFSAKAFSQSVKKLLESDYKERAEEISNIYRDRPLSPLDTAVYWIEYVIRHKGAFHLKSRAVELPWYQLYLVDVTCICFTIVGLFFTVICFTLKYLYILVFRGNRKGKSKME